LNFERGIRDTVHDKVEQGNQELDAANFSWARMILMGSYDDNMTIYSYQQVGCDIGFDSWWYDICDIYVFFNWWH